MTPEQRVQNAILGYLKKLKDKDYPIFYNKRQAGGFSYKKGLPDIYAVIDGKHYEIEVKRVGGHRSSMQDTWARIFKKDNISYMCVDSLDDFVKQFSKSLDEYDEKKLFIDDRFSDKPLRIAFKEDDWKALSEYLSKLGFRWNVNKKLLDKDTPSDLFHVYDDGLKANVSYVCLYQNVKDSTLVVYGYGKDNADVLFDGKKFIKI